LKSGLLLSEERVREVQEGGRVRQKLPFCHHQYSTDKQTPTVSHFLLCQTERGKGEQRRCPDWKKRAETFRGGSSEKRLVEHSYKWK